MGIHGGLVRSVFSRNRSFKTHESNGRNNMTERRRWSSVRLRSYLCGDEFKSVVADKDSASVRSFEASVSQLNSVLVEVDSCSAESSEATVTQPLQEDLTDKKDMHVYNTMSEEQAAIIIQSAFRGFLTRCQNERIKSEVGKQELIVGSESPSMESLGTSVEVQTGNSVEVHSIQEENLAAQHRLTQQKARAQVLRLKEDWDDSTLSSNMSKMRMQNRMEATTRRERALAYAFSQQLRICSKKKHAKSDGTEQNMGWSWLERWMATRLPESSSSLVETPTSNIQQVEPIYSNQRVVMIRKRLFDGMGEEKESCGSNEVTVAFDNYSVTTEEENSSFNSVDQSRVKATKGVSRRKTTPSHECGKDYLKVSKKDCSREAEKDAIDKSKKTGSVKCKNYSF
ncbi:putative IQ motif, EF-hand binding protein [Rosa chinensis]|uniref:Putative IQ motif, EF-hand binding protein n=1 Tax=Rosa chinensis TaxID=74649 RepID=A0A2P6S1R0_ROSCH|nr:protein IQ-DOMAIN 32 [Rosa chinensis]PRQ52613.1 putative IQ motif, EF-hand binding protein [Rosa chinensis]